MEIIIKVSEYEYYEKFLITSIRVTFIFISDFCKIQNKFYYFLDNSELVYEYLYLPNIKYYTL